MKSRRHIVGACLILVQCFAIARLAHAQEEGPIVIGQRRQYDKVHFDPAHFTLDLYGVYQNDKSSTDTSSTNIKQWVFNQIVGASTQGYVMSPNFLNMQLAGDFGLTQNFVDTGTDNTTNYGTIYDWDLQFNFLQSSNSPFQLYSRRTQDWVFREFGPALQNTNTDTGGGINIRSPVLPTYIAVSHLESSQTGMEEVDDYNYTRDALLWHTTILGSRGHTMNWDYNYSHINQTGIVDQEYEQHQAVLTDTYTFGSSGQHNLYSTLDYFHQSGSIDSDRFRWDERLIMQHSPTFLTRYNYTMDYYSISGSQTFRNRVAAGFTHELFQSLTTNGNVSLQNVQSEGFDSWEFAADINWNYRKIVPLGLLTLDLGLSWVWQDSSGTSSPTLVQNQPAIFTDPQPIVLVGPNIDPNTIIITDPSGLLIYRPGVDYTVQAFPNRVEINRVVGGQIAPGQPVLLDYVLTPLPGATTCSTVLSTGIRYDFQQGPLTGLSLFGRYTIARQSIDSSDPDAFFPNDFTDCVYGAEYRIWAFWLGGEHQTHDSTINPFRANRFFGRYTQQLWFTTRLNLNTAYSVIDYTDPENEVKLFTASFQLQHQFTRRLTGYVTVLYRNEDDQIGGQTTGFEEQFELRWNYRQTQVYFLLRNSQLDSDFQDEDYFFVQLGMRRDF